jgi:glycosyltransferase involved in cell wall biosynthesis
MDMQYKRAIFSVVTPNYNMAHFLPSTIESVLANLQPGDEYFVIDGGSTDSSVEIIRQYESRLTGWMSERDNGYADALAKGFRRCTGEFICWINSGDLLLKGAPRSARQILKETGVDLIFGDNVTIDEESRVLFQGRGTVLPLKYMMLYGGWTPMQESCFWRRSLYERTGGINPALKYAADYDFFLRASWAGHCLYVPSVFSAFRRHTDQKSIRGADRYQIERENSRREMITQLGISGAKRFALESFYRFAVRWRHHVARHFWVSRIKAGTCASQIIIES